VTDEATLRTAAEAGDVAAMIDLADLLTPQYEENDERFAEAESWFERAAETGSVEAMTAFGRFLHYNDQDTAAEWFRKAADLGHAEAMAGLGDYYDFMGDEAESGRWYREAAELGDQSALSNLEALERTRNR
jgi:TPR repeat protein